MWEPSLLDNRMSFCRDCLGNEAAFVYATNIYRQKPKAHQQETKTPLRLSRCFLFELHTSRHYLTVIKVSLVLKIIGQIASTVLATERPKEINQCAKMLTLKRIK